MAGEPTNLVYMEQGGDVLVIKSADGGILKGQASAGGAVSQAAAIADIALAAVTGVDGTGSNAASKADVDARLTSIQTKINAIITALEHGGVIAR